MGAGSTKVSREDRLALISTEPTCKWEGAHWMSSMTVGVSKFLNTGRPYRIGQCNTCQKFVLLPYGREG